MSRRIMFGASCMSVILLWSLIGLSEQAFTLLSEPTGGFKYMIPEGWTTAEFSGFKFKISRGVPSSGFAPNIAVVDEAFGGSVEDYITACLVPMEKGAEGFKLLEKKPFDTDSGIKGIKLVFESKWDGKQLMQTQYYFKGTKGKMLVITCSVLPEDGPKFADIFDTAMKTFQIVEPPDERPKN
ncbi:MAG: DcrB-related protein [Deltaproteobacteria bacterium]|nr:DcrB-related protein [Deltaproteobacteria bacterium]